MIYLANDNSYNNNMMIIIIIYFLENLYKILQDTIGNLSVSIIF